MAVPFALTGSKLTLAKPKQDARSRAMRLPMQGGGTVQETQVAERPACFGDQTTNTQISRGCSSLFRFVRFATAAAASFRRGLRYEAFRLTTC